MCPCLYVDWFGGWYANTNEYLLWNSLFKTEWRPCQDNIYPGDRAVSVSIDISSNKDRLLVWSSVTILLISTSQAALL